MYLAQI